MTTSATPEVSEQFGPYVTLDEAGAGATSIVYRARHVDTDQIVAVKVIRFDSKKAKMARRLKKLFLTEAAMAQRMQHANIVQIYDAQFTDDYAYIAMEFVQGVPLR